MDTSDEMGGRAVSLGMELQVAHRENGCGSWVRLLEGAMQRSRTLAIAAFLVFSAALTLEHTPLQAIEESCGEVTQSECGSSGWFTMNWGGSSNCSGDPREDPRCRSRQGTRHSVNTDASDLGLCSQMKNFGWLQ